MKKQDQTFSPQKYTLSERKQTGKFKESLEPTKLKSSLEAVFSWQQKALYENQLVIINIEAIFLEIYEPSQFKASRQALKRVYRQDVDPHYLNNTKNIPKEPNENDRLRVIKISDLYRKLPNNEQPQLLSDLLDIYNSPYMSLISNIDRVSIYREKKNGEIDRSYLNNPDYYLAAIYKYVETQMPNIKQIMNKEEIGSHIGQKISHCINKSKLRKTQDFSLREKSTSEHI